MKSWKARILLFGLLFVSGFNPVKAQTGVTFISAAERLQTEIASPGLDYNTPVVLVCPGWESVRCARIEFKPGAAFDLYLPPSASSTPLPVVVYLVSQTRQHFIDFYGKPLGNYVTVVSWAADIASRGLAVLVPDLANPKTEMGPLLDWIALKGETYGLDPGRIGWYAAGYETAILPALIAEGRAQSLRALVVAYGGWLASNKINLEGNLPFLYVRAGSSSYVAKVNAYMGPLALERIAAGLPTEFIDLPGKALYFDWLERDETVLLTLQRILDFLVERLK